MIENWYFGLRSLFLPSARKANQGRFDLSLSTPDAALIDGGFESIRHAQTVDKQRVVVRSFGTTASPVGPAPALTTPNTKKNGDLSGESTIVPNQLEGAPAQNIKSIQWNVAIRSMDLR
jgi:hypothetical protein